MLRGAKHDPIGIEFAYVPLSRVRRLVDLTILRMFDPSVGTEGTGKCWLQSHDGGVQSQR